MNARVLVRTKGLVRTKSLALNCVCGAGLVAATILVVAPNSTQTAVANGDTRTITLYHAHRKDSGTFTFRRNGRYDSATLSQLNYFLRDWRNDEQIRMDPRLFDVIWEAHRMVGARGYIKVLSSYRSPRTNGMLRRRSRAVAKNSQHMYGKAMDMRFDGVNMHRVREAAMKLQRGGVGWYRSGFVHLDVGSVRAWPRMSYSQLARLFPDGKTVHIASNGQTLPGYEEARSVIAARNGTYVPTLAQTRQRGFLARLFGFGDSGDEAELRTASRDRRQFARGAPRRQTGPTRSDDNTAASFFRRDAALRSRASAPPTRVAAARAVARTAPANTAATPSAASPPAKAAARVATPAKLEPKTTAPSVEDRGIVAPLPPRRPSEAQIAALIENAVPGVPLPPSRPEDLIVVAETPAASLPPDARGRLAALIGSTSPGAITGKLDLPSVITQGSTGGNPSSTPDVMAFAAPITTITPKDRALNTRRAGRIRSLALRQTMPAAPAIARAIGVRSGAREARQSKLVAARMDRSNSEILTRPVSFTNSWVHTLMGSALIPLRSAARINTGTIVFADREQLAMRFSRFSAPRPLRARTYQRFTALRAR